MTPQQGGKTYAKQQKSSKSTVTKSVKVMLIASLMLCLVFAGATVQSQKLGVQRASAVQTQEVQTRAEASELSSEFDLQKEGADARKGSGEKRTADITLNVGGVPVTMYFNIYFEWESSLLGKNQITTALLDQRAIYGNQITSGQTITSLDDGVKGIWAYKSEFSVLDSHKVEFSVFLTPHYYNNTDERDVQWAIYLDGQNVQWAGGESRWYVPHNGQPTEQRDYGGNG